MKFNPLLSFLDVLHRKALQISSGIPWTGRKRQGAYTAYFPVIKGSRFRLGMTQYKIAHAGIRATNKPQSQRDRHRLAVAVRKLTPGFPGVKQSQSEMDKAWKRHHAGIKQIQRLRLAMK